MGTVFFQLLLEKLTMSEIYDDANDVDYQPEMDLKYLQLPPIVLGRVKALKNLQLDKFKVETEYYQEVHLLDVEYQAKYNEINEKRAKVISGLYEPSGTELEWKSCVKEEKDDSESITEDLVIHPDFPADAKGLPKFWLHALKNANETCLLGLIEPHDEPVLEHLVDITVSMHKEDSGFTLRFFFQKNPFFSNQVLTKEYTMRSDPDPKSPLEYEGPKIVGYLGCPIAWKDGMDVTDIDVKINWKEGTMAGISGN